MYFLRLTVIVGASFHNTIRRSKKSRHILPVFLKDSNSKFSQLQMFKSVQMNAVILVSACLLLRTSHAHKQFVTEIVEHAFTISATRLVFLIWAHCLYFIKSCAKTVPSLISPKHGLEGSNKLISSLVVWFPIQTA